MHEEAKGSKGVKRDKNQVRMYIHESMRTHNQKQSAQGTVAVKKIDSMLGIDSKWTENGTASITMSLFASMVRLHLVSFV